MRHLRAESNLRQEGHQRQCQYQRGHQCCHHRVGHRRKNFALVPLHGEDRQVGNDDDDDREHRRPPDFDDCFKNGSLLRSVIVILLGLPESPEDVLDDDNRAVDDDPEIHCPQ